MTFGLARCALLPLFALVKLREKSCEDMYDSVGRWLPALPIHRYATAARLYGLPEPPMTSGLTIAESTINRALAALRAPATLGPAEAEREVLYGRARLWAVPAIAAFAD